MYGDATSFPLQTREPRLAKCVIFCTVVTWLDNTVLDVRFQACLSRPCDQVSPFPFGPHLNVQINGRHWTAQSWRQPNTIAARQGWQQY